MRDDSVVVTGGVRLHLRRCDGARARRRPFLLVHGLASNARLWDGVVASLAAAGHPVVAVDQRGHGRSAKPDSGYDLPRARPISRSVIDHLDWEQPVVAASRGAATSCCSWPTTVPIWCTRWRSSTVAGSASATRSRTGRTAAASCTRPTSPARRSTRVAAAVRLAHPGWPATGVDGTMANFEVLEDGTVRPWLSLDHHLAVLHDLWARDPAELYAGVSVPVLLLPADHGTDGQEQYDESK